MLTKNNPKTKGDYKVKKKKLRQRLVAGALSVVMFFSSFGGVMPAFAEELNPDPTPSAITLNQDGGMSVILDDGTEIKVNIPSPEPSEEPAELTDGQQEVTPTPEPTPDASPSPEVTPSEPVPTETPAPSPSTEPTAEPTTQPTAEPTTSPAPQVTEEAEPTPTPTPDATPTPDGELEEPIQEEPVVEPTEEPEAIDYFKLSEELIAALPTPEEVAKAFLNGDEDYLAKVEEQILQLDEYLMELEMEDYDHLDLVKASSVQLALLGMYELPKEELPYVDWLKVIHNDKSGKEITVEKLDAEGKIVLYTDIRPENGEGATGHIKVEPLNDKTTVKVDGETSFDFTYKTKSPTGKDIVKTLEAVSPQLKVEADGDFIVTIVYKQGDVETTSSTVVRLPAAALYAEASGETKTRILDVTYEFAPGFYFLTLDGATAFCIDKGLTARDGLQYEYQGLAGSRYRQIVNYWGGFGPNQNYRAFSQGAIWGNSFEDFLETCIALGVCTDSEEDRYYMYTEYSHMLREMLHVPIDNEMYIYACTCCGGSVHQRMLSPLKPTSVVPTPDDVENAEFDTVSVSASGTESYTARGTQKITLEKWATMTLERLKGVVFNVAINNADSSTAKMTTDAEGKASASWEIHDSRSQSWAVTSADVIYCTNFDTLTPEEQASIQGKGIATSLAEATAIAQADCNAQAASAAAAAKAAATAAAKRALANHTTTFSITEDRTTVTPGFNFIETQWQQSGSLTGPTSTGESGVTTVNPYHFDVENEPWRTEISIVKYDTADNKPIIKDTEFDIYEWSEKAGKYAISTNYAVVRLDDGSYTVRVINQAYRDDFNLWTDETGDGYLFYTQDNLGKFFITEKDAPEGYIRDVAAFMIEIAQEDEDVTVRKGCSVDDNATYFDVINDNHGQYVHQDDEKFYNHRQYGDLILYKYDDEAEANYANGDRILQGEGLIDGAVYALIAREDIVVNGNTLYTKGELVQTVTIGESYVTDEYGYALDENGDRLINDTLGKLENSALVNAAVTKTPGAARFVQLELGEYVVVEKQASYGYLADTEAWRDYDSLGTEDALEDSNDLQKYNVTITYNKVGANDTEITEFVNTTPETFTDDTVNIVTRDETAANDVNNLTMDDTLGDHAIYSGDFVKKQAAKFIKLRDWYVDTEKYPEAGAGFKIYLINDLAQVKDGTIAPQNGEHWTQADIARYFYDYDFDVEKTAKVYKRQTEDWTAGDTAWLEKATDRTEDGWTNTLYRVGEMFSDSQGYFETPELPFGQYVLVQTTWVENTRSVQPVLVTITKDTYLHQGTQGDVEPDTTYGRFLGNETTETYLRIEKTDLDAVTTDDNHSTTHANSKRVESVLKPGATYKIKLMSNIKDFDSTVWRVSPQDQYMTYYDTTLNVTKGTDEEPFDIQVIVDENGKVVDAYIELAYMLPVGTYELTELTAPEGFVLNGYEEKMEDVSADGFNFFEPVDDAREKLTFTIDNDSVYPNGQMGDHDRNDKKDIMTDQYGRLITTIYQPNIEQRGVFELYKVGEQLAGGERNDNTLLEKLANDANFREIRLADANVNEVGDMQFEYAIAPISGAVFEIYAAENIYTQQLDADELNLYLEDELARDLVHEKDDLIATITTDNYGYAFAKDLRIGKYYVKEVVAGDGFVLNENIWNFEITAAQDTENFIYYGTAIENVRQKIELEVMKRDADTKEGVAGAAFALVADEDILVKVAPAADVDDQTHYYVDNNGDLVATYRDVVDAEDIVIDLHGATHLPILDEADYVKLLAKGEVIATAISDADGKIVFDVDLPLNKYKVVELEAPEGYTMNTTLTGRDELASEIAFDATYAGNFGGQDVEVQLHNEETDGLAFINQKTKFLFTKVDQDSVMDINGAKFEIWEIAMDANGRPIKEIGGYKLVGKVAEWTTNRSEYSEFVLEDGFTLTVKANEKETNPKETHVANGGDPIFAHCDDFIAEGKAFGHYVEGLKEGHTYILREVQAPKGYVGYEWSDDETREENAIENEIVEEIRFTVADQNKVIWTETVNQRTLGEIHITKEGEFLTDATVAPWNIAKNYFYTIFDWVLGRVQNAEFEIYVREDIYTPDDIDVIATYENSEGATIELKKDVLVDTIVTDVNGIASIYDLPLGKYYIKEVGAGDGHFVLNTEIIDVELGWLGQEIPIVINDTTKYINDRQVIDVTVNKLVYKSELDKYSNTPITQPEGQAPVDLRIPLEGAVFALVSAQEIQGYTIDPATKAVMADPNKVIPAYTLIESFKSDENGEAKVVSDLPCALYYIVEIEAPKGYHTSDKVITVDARYKGQTGTSAMMINGKYQNVLTLEYDFEDIPTVVAITKTDIATGEEIVGAKLTVTDANGKVVDEWVSDGKVHYILNLLVGKTYTLTETLPAPGYVTAESIDFTILDKDADDEIVVVQDVEMKDDFTKVTIRKESIVDGSPVVGAKLEIKDLEGNGLYGWTTDEDGEYEIEYLPIGKYVLTETYAPGNFAIAEDIEFEVLDTGEIQKVTMIDDVRALTVAKYEMGTTKFVPGATLQIIEKATGEVVEEFVTTDTWTYFQSMLPGEYILKEVKAPAGYVLNEEVVEFTIEALKEEKEVVLENDFTKVVIRKEHITNGKPLEGATLQIKDADGKVLHEWKTDKTGEKQIDRLPVGDYTLVEISAPSGYYKAEAVKFTVTETGEIQKVVMKDAPIPEPAPENKPANGVFYLSLDGGKTWMNGWGNWHTGDNGEEGDSIKVVMAPVEKENPITNVGAIVALVAVGGLLVLVFRKKKEDPENPAPQDEKEEGGQD